MGLLEQRELIARRRLDELREEADRLQAEMAVVEREWNQWVIARSRVGEVLAPGDDDAGPDAREDLADRSQSPRASGPSGAAKPKTMVPMWRPGLVWSALFHVLDCRLIPGDLSQVIMLGPSGVRHARRLRGFRISDNCVQ
ncbi:hypothetical protein [Streptacidiphilus sp. MAP12-33]|uniref:hypothetical protein n=1 Tax=Streptacidiphilus sp. MAP12-33 TaxID=3156266 RepID=UPI003517E49E